MTATFPKAKPFGSRLVLNILTVSLGVFIPYIPPARATTTTVAITEIMYDASGNDTDHEWIEITNLGNEIFSLGEEELKTMRLTDTSAHLLSHIQGETNLNPGASLVITANPGQFLSDYPNFSGSLYKASITLGNTQGSITLSQTGEPLTILASTTYTKTSGAAGNGKTLVMHDAVWSESAETGGTPGFSSALVNSPATTPIESKVTQPTTVPTLTMTEIMYDLTGNDTDHEWIEYQNTGAVALTIAAGETPGSWRLGVGDDRHPLTPISGGLTVASQNFFLIVQDGPTFLADHPGITKPVFSAHFSLPNKNGSINISPDSTTWLGEVAYQSNWGGNGNGKSLAHADDNTWNSSAQTGGSPGEVNPPPAAVVATITIESSPADTQISTTSTTQSSPPAAGISSSQPVMQEITGTVIKSFSASADVQTDTNQVIKILFHLPKGTKPSIHKNDRLRVSGTLSGTVLTVTDPQAIQILKEEASEKSATEDQTAEAGALANPEIAPTATTDFQLIQSARNQGFAWTFDLFSAIIGALIGWFLGYAVRTQSASEVNLPYVNTHEDIFNHHPGGPPDSR